MRTVTEVDVRGDEAGGAAERADAEVADERWSAGDPAGEYAERAVVSVRGGSVLLKRAERNTRLMLTGLLRSLGFTHVEIQFAAV